LVILDEFQRYRQILDEKDADPFLKALLEPEDSVVPPAVLLLSATPYRLLSTRWEEARGALAHSKLLELIEFLAGADVRERAKALFADFGDKLRDIAAHADASRPELVEEVARAAKLRDDLRGGGKEPGRELSRRKPAQRYDTRAKLNENSGFADFFWCGRALRHNLKSSRKRSI
jgi:hypothetical protein